MSDNLNKANNLYRSSKALHYSVKIAVLSALATIIMLWEFPLLFIAPGFYKLDFSEVIVLMGGFSLGPLAAVIIELIKNLLNLVINGTVTGCVGELANFLIGVSFTVPAAFIYKYNKSRKGALIGSVVGVIAMALLGTAINYFVVIPAYAAAFKVDVSTLTVFNDAELPLWKFVLVCTLPFNIIKGIITSVITFIAYKRVSPILHV